MGRGTSRAATVAAALREAGFVVSRECHTRPSCFDLVARKSGKNVFLKAQPDVGTYSLKDSIELKGISEFFAASSVLVGEKTRDKPLKDDTVYSRYLIPTITQRTLENIVLQKIKPLIQANPGGYYVEIDGEAVRRRRQELKLSVGEAAKLIGISRPTAYCYEQGTTKASVTVAYRIMRTLGIPVAKPIDIFESPGHKHGRCFITSAKRIITRNPILRTILSKFPNCRIAAVVRAPFDFVISVPKGNVSIIGVIAGNREPELIARIEELMSISQTMQVHPVLISEGAAKLNTHIAGYRPDDFPEIGGAEDLIMGR